MQERGADLEAVGNLAHTVVENGVAGDPEHSTPLAAQHLRECHMHDMTARPAG